MAVGLRARKKARLHQGIVDTAVELFRERSYEKTTVEEIVRRVEISQPTFYKYFGSKDAVLREVAGGMLRDWAQEAEAAARQEGEWSEERAADGAHGLFPRARWTPDQRASLPDPAQRGTR